jgi:hypothetical protein
MNRSLIPAIALAGAALFGLAGCGQATEATDQPGTTAADDPIPTSGPATDTAGGGVSGSTGSTAGSTGLDPSLAQWPATGCGSRSVVSVDYGRMPTGFGTPEEAVENSPAAGVPDGVLTMAPDAGKGPAQVWVVDPDSNEILASVSVFRGPDGWFVDGVMTCS